MDVKALFQAVSRRMHADFEASSQIRHSGSKGAVRENALRNFFENGRLPEKYAVGSGEVVGRVRDTSRQCDLIIYDRMNGVSLVYDDTSQVYPIDCVYGIVEVKSALSKTELIDSLDKIAAFKDMAPGGAQIETMGGFTSSSPRLAPFGAVFAYGLAGNSLESLRENLVEWEATHPPTLWPNYICVLGEGVICHHPKDALGRALHSAAITDGAWPSSVYFREDSLFEFYCAVHDLCAQMRLGPVELMRYYEPALRIGRFVVEGRAELMRGAPPGVPVRYTEAALARIVAEGQRTGPETYEATLLKILGQVPQGLSARQLSRKGFLFNPDGLPGYHELGASPVIRDDDGGVQPSAPALVPYASLVIDGDDYVIPLAALQETDLEPVGG